MHFERTLFILQEEITTLPLITAGCVFFSFPKNNVSRNNELLTKFKCHSAKRDPVVAQIFALQNIHTADVLQQHQQHDSTNTLGKHVANSHLIC